jgi:ribonuclease-3
MNLLGRLAQWLGIGSDRPPLTRSSEGIDFESLERCLKYRITNRTLFALALSHRSHLQSIGAGTLSSNERLEFLGDAILGLVVAEQLYHRYTDAAEGHLTKVRSCLVNRRSLSVYAHQLHLEDFMLMSAGAAGTGMRGIEKILADGFEAIVGAIYIDGGYDCAKRFIEEQIRVASARGTVQTTDENFKSQLLEYSQAEGLGIPRYTTINEEGPDHDRTFTVEVYLGEIPYGVGMGKNKKVAEQLAAEKALQKIQAL